MKPLEIGDVIEVVKDFDLGVVSPGDRALYYQAEQRRVRFCTRMPCWFAAPIYDVPFLLFEEKTFAVVDHVSPLIEEPWQHPVLRPERQVNYMASVFRFERDIQKIWGLDLRYASAKEKFDELLAKILTDEPEQTMRDIRHNFFANALDPSNRCLTRLEIQVHHALETSIARLVQAGRVQKVGHRYLPTGS